jgi:integrase
LELQETPGDLLQIAMETGHEEDGFLGAELAVPILHETLTEGDWSPDILAQAKKIAASYGTVLDSERHRELCLALTYAEIDVLERLVITHRGGVPPATPILNTKAFDILTGEPLQPTRLPQQKGVAIRIRQATKEYLDATLTGRSHGWTEQTRRQTKVTLRFFADFTKDAPLDSITRQSVAAFIEALSKLHPDYGKRGEGELDLDAVQKKHPAEPGKGLSIKTLKRHCGALAGLFEWARDENHIAGDNPAKGHRFTKSKAAGNAGKEREPFSTQELRALLTGPKVAAQYEQRARPECHSAETTLRWLIPIALYTGMRLDEICGLRVMDVCEEGNIEFFNVRSYEGHRLKTPASERLVPIHPALIEIGFGDYHAHVQEAGHEFLFPALKCGGPDKKRSWYIGKRFTDYRNELKIPDAKVFHSFRKNVATVLEQERVPENEAAQLLGHKKPKITYGLYSGGLSLKELKRVVDAIKYPNLDLRHLHKPKSKAKAIQAKKESAEAVPL